ncbi:MAG: GNAT family N-acetyltransferase [Gammaproteobacteria bacterium]|nr:GNAT family N-acetyltransferase [Gammaproteobacteria bacterium]
MKIREAKAGDEAELVNLFTTLDRETRFMLMEPGERKTTIERQAKLIEEFAQSNSRVLFVANEGEKLLGFLGGTSGTANRERHTIHIAMGVLASHWGKSIGTQLMQTMCVWAKANCFYRIELTAMETNQRAIALYEKVGFEIEGVRKGSLKVDGNFVNELYMG